MTAAVAGESGAAHMQREISAPDRLTTGFEAKKQTRNFGYASKRRRRDLHFEKKNLKKQKAVAGCRIFERGQSQNAKNLWTRAHKACSRTARLSVIKAML